MNMLNLKNTKETIDLLESIDTSDDYAYERAVLAFLKLNGLPILIYKMPAGLTFYHTRTHVSEDYFFKISDISIPPRECIKDFARCNRPFQSVFYCSENRPTSYMELIEYWVETKNIGDILRLTNGKWEIKKPINAIIITSPDASKRISDFDKEHGQALDEFLSKSKGEGLEAQKMFYNFLFEKFRKPAKKDVKTYIITSAYCNIALMRANGDAEAIYYPSVPYEQKGVNLSINKDFFKPENIELKAAICNVFSITENAQKKHSFGEVELIRAKELNLSKDLIVWE